MGRPFGHGPEVEGLPRGEVPGSRRVWLAPPPGRHGGGSSARSPGSPGLPGASRGEGASGRRRGPPPRWPSTRRPARPAWMRALHERTSAPPRPAPTRRGRRQPRARWATGGASGRAPAHGSGPSCAPQASTIDGPGRASCGVRYKGRRMAGSPPTGKPLPPAQRASPTRCAGCSGGGWPSRRSRSSSGRSRCATAAGILALPLRPASRSPARPAAACFTSTPDRSD